MGEADFLCQPTGMHETHGRRAHACTCMHMQVLACTAAQSSPSFFSLFISYFTLFSTK